MFTDHPKIIDHCLNHSQPLNLESYTKGVAEAKRVAAENANAAKKKKKRVGLSHTSSSAPAVSSSEKTVASTMLTAPIIGSAPPSSAAPSATLSLVRVGPNRWRGEVDGKYFGHFATESSGRCAFNAYEIEEAARKKRKKQQSLIEASAASSFGSPAPAWSAAAKLLAMVTYSVVVPAKLCSPWTFETTVTIEGTAHLASITLPAGGGAGDTVLFWGKVAADSSFEVDADSVKMNSKPRGGGGGGSAAAAR